MNTVWRVLGYASIGLVAVSAWSTVRALERDRPVRTRSLMVTMIVALAVLFVYDRVIPGGPNGWAWGLGAVGLAGGALVARSTRLGMLGPEVVGRPSRWLVVQWAVLFAVAQLASLGVGPMKATSGVAAVFLATGATVGSSLVMLRRRADAVRAASTGGVTCPHCHAPLVGDSGRCGTCGWSVLVRAGG